jgi:DNA repair exonuclease SbcCD ATPase subunit
VIHEVTVRENLTNAQLQSDLFSAPVDWSDMDRIIATARDGLTKWTVEYQRASQEHRRLIKQIMEVQNLEIGVECPTCGQQMTTKHVAQEVERLKLAGEAELVKSREAEQAKAQWEHQVGQHEMEKKRQWEVHSQSGREWSTKLSEAKSQLKDVMEAREWLTWAEQHTQTLREAMKTAIEAPDPWGEKMRQARANIERLEGEIGGIADQKSLAEVKLNILNFWVEGLGPKGLRSYILDSRLQELTDAANEWVRLLTGGTFWVRFETQTPGRAKKKLRNQLNIRVFKYNPDGRIIERNYRGWSGGEKRRVSWAIDFGLSRLIARRASKTYDLLILDEVFNHVDSAGGEALVEMLEYLRRERSSIFIIEHNADFQQHFDNRITMRKQDARSTIVEERNENKVEAKPTGTAKRGGVPRRAPVRTSRARDAV